MVIDDIHYEREIIVSVKGHDSWISVGHQKDTKKMTVRVSTATVKTGPRTLLTDIKFKVNLRFSVPPSKKKKKVRLQ